MQISTGQSAALKALIESIRRSLADTASVNTPSQRVAALLPPFLAEPDLLLESQRATNPTRYLQHILHVEPLGEFSIVSLAWLPGQATPIHDHVCWCAVGVYEGTEHEIRFRVSRDGQRNHLTECQRTLNPAGSTIACSPGDDVHRVANRGPDVAISIHVYGADIAALGSSVYRCYDDIMIRRVRSGA